MPHAVSLVHPGMKSALALVLVLAGALGEARLAFADAESEAHGKAVQGEAELAAGKHAEAARSFEEAYRLQPLPLYQRRQGDALKGAGDCTRAIPAFQAYHEKTKDSDVLKEIQSCKETLAKGSAGRLEGPVLWAQLLRTGRYAEAEREARAAQGDPRLAARAHTALGRALLAQGQEPEAMAAFERALAADPKAFRARLSWGLALLARGEVKRARPVLEKFFDLYNNDEAKDAPALTDVAVAMRSLERWHDAHRVFGEAVKADKSYARAHVQWGNLLLEKYNVTEAKQSFDDALRVDPDLPAARVGLARVYLEGAHEVPKALEEVEKALKVNPHLSAARVLLARLHLLSEDTERAREEAGKALAVNPGDREALAMRAAAYYLADDREGFEGTKREALARRGGEAEFFLAVASHASVFHRYEEAIGLIEEGLKRDPSYWPAYAELGLNYLRLGNEQRGKELLQKSWDKDPFNARTKNILDLYDDSIQNYRFALSPHFRIRFHKDDERVLRPYVSAHLERAYREMAARYGFEPRVPITVELFARAEDFGVRTVGLPRLASVGVCFGRVVTSMSPRAGRAFNWGQVLWHELNHVFTLQLSRARVPRWLTEGLAVVEEGKGHPSWARKMDGQMMTALRGGRLRKISELNLGFTRARSVPEILQAYYQAAHAATFLLERVGDAGVVRLVRGFGEGKRLAALLGEVASLTPEQFDAEFKTWLAKRLQHLAANFEVDYDAFDLEALEAKSRAEPKSADVWAELGAARFKKRQVSEAEEAVKTALGLAPAHPLAKYVAAELAVFRKQYDEAIGAYEGVLAAGKDGYELRKTLGLLYRKKNLTDKAREHLEAAKKRNPQATLPYEVLAEIYEKAGQKAEAIAELERLARMDQKNFRALRRVARHWAKNGGAAKVIEFGELALYLNPFDAELHLELGRAHGASGAWDRALAELKTALDAGYKFPAEVQVEISQVHLAAGRRQEARDAAQEAFKLDANHARAKEILEQTK
jgi:tetratricopeptide (TPR) repeat protein